MTDINQEIKDLEATLVSLKAKAKAQEPTLTPISFESKPNPSQGTLIIREYNSGWSFPFRSSLMRWKYATPVNKGTTA